MRPFLITVDTEGDNLWARPSPLEVRNAEFLPRFQRLCEEFGFKPTYLTNWEMAQAPAFVALARRALAAGAAEVGCHIHAWDSPPAYALTADDKRHHPYLIEYPDEVLRAKLRVQTAALEDRFGVKMLSHRAGRWAFDERYARALVDAGYRVDCSVTPGVSWRAQMGDPARSGGSDYRGFPHEAYRVDLADIRRPGNSPLLEVPMTTRPSWLGRHAAWSYRVPLLRRWASRAMPQVHWLRPTRDNRRALLHFARAEATAPYLEFMIHSSEFMPGASPYFRDGDEVEYLYATLHALFTLLAPTHVGMTLAEFERSIARAETAA